MLITRGWCLSDPCLSSSVCHRFCDCSRPLLCLCGHRGNVSLLYDRGPSSLLSFWCWSIILVWQTCILPPAGVWLNSVKIWGRPDVGIRSSSSLLLANFVIAKSSEKRPNMDDNSFPDCLHMNSSTTSSAAVGFLSNLSRLFRSDDVFPSSHSFYFSLSPLSSLSVSLPAPLSSEETVVSLNSHTMTRQILKNLRPRPSSFICFPSFKVVDEWLRSCTIVLSYSTSTHISPGWGAVCKTGSETALILVNIQLRLRVS